MKRFYALLLALLFVATDASAQQCLPPIAWSSNGSTLSCNPSFAVDFLGGATCNGSTVEVTAPSAGGKAVYGDGSDGAHTVAGTETLTRDVLYTTLTVPAGTTLNTAGFIVRASTSITV